jgi:hypothetical protein
VFIDNEWSLKGSIRANVLVTRSAFYLLNEIKGMRDLNAGLLRGGTRAVVGRICRAIGVEITARDWEEFLGLESDFTAVVTGGRPNWRARMRRRARRALERFGPPLFGVPQVPLDRP